MFVDTRAASITTALRTTHGATTATTTAVTTAVWASAPPTEAGEEPGDEERSEDRQRHRSDERGRPEQRPDGDQSPRTEPVCCPRPLHHDEHRAQHEHDEQRLRQRHRRVEHEVGPQGHDAGGDQGGERPAVAAASPVQHRSRDGEDEEDRGDLAQQVQDDDHAGLPRRRRQEEPGREGQRVPHRVVGRRGTVGEPVAVARRQLLGEEPVEPGVVQPDGGPGGVHAPAEAEQDADGHDRGQPATGRTGLTHGRRRRRAPRSRRARPPARRAGARPR